MSKIVVKHGVIMPDRQTNNKIWNTFLKHTHTYYHLSKTNSNDEKFVSSLRHWPICVCDRQSDTWVCGDSGTLWPNQEKGRMLKFVCKLKRTSHQSAI